MRYLERGKPTSLIGTTEKIKGLVIDFLLFGMIQTIL